MAEPFNDRLIPELKSERYADLMAQVASVLEAEPNLMARLSSLVAMLAHTFDGFFWTGVYLVDPDRDQELVVGPYQGTLGCLRIAFGRGVCGTVAQSRSSLIVEDVHAFAGHIACDSRSASEIVVPLIAADGSLVGVLDIDSDRPAHFDETDRLGLEALVRIALARPQ